MLTPPPITVLRGHTAAVNSIAFFGPNHLLSGSLDGRVKVFDLTTRRPSVDILAHTDSILSVSKLVQGESFISAGKDGHVHAWNMTDTTAPTCSYKTGALHFCNSATDSYGNDQTHFVSPSAIESNVLFWDVRTPNPALIISAPSDWRFGMLTALLYKSGSITAGFESGGVLKIDLRRPEYTAAAELASLSMHPVLALATSSDDKYLIAGGGSTELSFVAGNDSSFLNHKGDASLNCTVSKISLKGTGTSTINFRSDDRIFVSGHWDGSLQIRERKSLKVLAVLRHHREAVYATAFVNGNISREVLNFNMTSGNDGVFASASKDGTIAIWDLFADKMKNKS